MNSPLFNTHISYFAYGSNMLRERLIARKVVLLDKGQPAVAEGFKLVFNKKSSDSSNKANLIPEIGAKSWGVVFTVDPCSLDGLDSAEGAPEHYQRENIVIRLSNSKLDAMTYLAQSNHLSATPDQPWDWYLALILAGAFACTDIPPEWIRHLRQIGSAKISNEPRSKSGIEAINQLKAAGYDQWQALLKEDAE